jgi:hypothetical protein
MSISTDRAVKGIDLGALAGVIGIAIPALGLAVLPIWQFPGTASTGAEIVSFVADNRAALQVVMVVNTLGVTLWGVFGIRVWSELRRADRPGSELAPYWAAGLVGFVTLLLAGFSVFDVLVYRPPGPDVAVVLYDLAFGLLAISGMPTSVALFAYAAATYRSRVLPRSTAHLGALTATLHLALPLSFVIDRGPLSLEGLVITVVPAFLWAWILVTAVAMLRRTP